MSEHHEGVEHSHPMAVAVITPDGTFPNDDVYRRAYTQQPVSEVLAAAAAHLRLTNTTDWKAFVDNRPVDPAKTFAANDLAGIVEVEWHKEEGGGGA